MVKVGSNSLPFQDIDLDKGGGGGGQTNLHIWSVFFKDRMDIVFVVVPYDLPVIFFTFLIIVFC